LAGVGVLIGQNRIWRFGGNAFGRVDVMIRRIEFGGGRHHDHVRAERFQIPHFFLAGFIRHHENRAVSSDRAGQRQADAGVAAGRFDDGAAGFQIAHAFGAVNHGLADAVFDAAAGIQRFNFRQHQRFQSAR